VLARAWWTARKLSHATNAGTDRSASESIAALRHERSQFQGSGRDTELRILREAEGATLGAGLVITLTAWNAVEQLDSHASGD